MSEKLQLGIYRLKDEIMEIKKGRVPKKVSINIEYLTKFFRSKNYSLQVTQPNLSVDFDLFLYYKRNKSEIKWKDFIEKIADTNEPILKSKSTNSESYVLLIENKITHIKYATTGGFGHTALQGIIEGDFGLEILSRLLKAEDKTLRSTKEKNLVGGILGEVKFFRNDYNLNENENFGNFYQELHSSLNKKLLTSVFGFSKNEIDSECLCVAKNSFTIKKSISFDQLVVIIKNCENLINTTKPVVEINGVKKLTKGHKSLILELENEIDKAILNVYNGKGSGTSIELCHRDFDKYLHADNYILKYRINGSENTKEYDEPLKNISTIIQEIKKSNSNLDENKLALILSNTHIESRNSDGETITQDLLRNHFYTEVTYKDKSYFLSDSEWFEIKSNFTEKLNEQCQSFINENRFLKQLETWDYKNETENDFNSKHIGKSDFLVFDKFTPENIEACDILYWDTTNIYFIHVKAGFDNSMRDLSHQIYIAARRIKEDSKTGYPFLNQLYVKVKSSTGTSNYSKEAKKQLNKITQDKFIDLFKNRKLVFVLAVLDTSASTRKFSEIDKFNSNIAKFSLHELIKNMRNLAVDFRIYEIKK